jgi:hypothetical protein
VNQTYVNIYMGRAFFFAGGAPHQPGHVMTAGEMQQRGHLMGDSIIVTLVHELAHAVFNASDVPIAGSGLVLTLMECRPLALLSPMPLTTIRISRPPAPISRC